MTKFVELIRIIFVSFEFLFLIIVFSAYQFYPDLLSEIGQKFHINQEFWKYIPTIPSGLLIASLSYSWKILTPLDNSSNRPLYEWPDYWKLKLRIIVSIIYCGLSAISAAIIWFFGENILKDKLGFIFIVSIGIPIIVLMHQILAAFMVREIIEPQE